MLATYPRIVHAEHLRHRSFSYSVASSRALPIQKMIEQVLTDPVIPVYWGRNQKGMGAKEELTGRQQRKAEARWLYARDQAVECAHHLLDLNRTVGRASCDGYDPEDEGVGLSKELTNRILEPWMWVTVLVTGTDWQNFFWLRCHPAAQPEIRVAAEMMRTAYEQSTPSRVVTGQWHLPFIDDTDWEDGDFILHGSGGGAKLTVPERMGQLYRILEMVKQVSAGRSARTSYLTHFGTRDLREDVRLYNGLIEGASKDPEEPMHLSPLEHQATPLTENEYVDQKDMQRLAELFPALARSIDLQLYLNRRNNLQGWKSFRSTIPNESGRDAR
jgi:hypothetical protein